MDCLDLVIFKYRYVYLHHCINTCERFWNDLMSNGYTQWKYVSQKLYSNINSKRHPLVHVAVRVHSSVAYKGIENVPHAL